MLESVAPPQLHSGMTTIYKEVFVPIPPPGESGEENLKQLRNKIARAAHDLSTSDKILLACSSGGYGKENDPLNIMFLTPEDAVDSDIEKAVISACKKEGVELQSYTTQSEANGTQCAWRGMIECSAAQVHQLEQHKLYVKSLNQGLLRDHISHLALRQPSIPISTQTLSNNTTDVSMANHNQVTSSTAHDVPTQQQAEPVFVTPERYALLTKAKKTLVEEEIKKYVKDLNDISAGNAASAAIRMILTGIVAIGKEMGAKWLDLLNGGFSAGTIALVIESIGGLGVLLGIIAGIAAAVAAATILFKNAVNVCLLVNGSSKVLYFDSDAITNGQRGKVVMELSALKHDDKNNPVMYSVGVYLYHKFQVGGHPIGFYGSLASVAISRDRENPFSIGMSCPNLIGENWARLFNDKPEVSIKDEIDYLSADEIDGVSIHVASKNGSVNYMIASVSK